MKVEHQRGPAVLDPEIVAQVLDDAQPEVLARLLADFSQAFLQVKAVPLPGIVDMDTDGFPVLIHADLQMGEFFRRAVAAVNEGVEHSFADADQEVIEAVTQRSLEGKVDTAPPARLELINMINFRSSVVFAENGFEFLVQGFFKIKGKSECQYVIHWVHWQINGVI